MIALACGGRSGLLEPEPSSEKSADSGAPVAPPQRDSGRPSTDAEPAPKKPLPPMTQATEVDLGEALSGATVTLMVPPSALGFNVVVRGEARDEVAIETITSPGGEAVLTARTIVGGAFETSVGEGIASASVPQNKLPSTAPLERGAWSITLSGPPGKTLRASARIQLSGDGAFHGGVADMHVYLPKGLVVEDPVARHVVSAASAERDRSIEARLSTFYGGLERSFGVRRGDVAFHDVDASLLRIRDERQLMEAFAVSSGASDGLQAIHVLFTNDLDFGDGIWGIASGIPGAATRTGTSLSGVILALTPDTPARLDGLALLHEIGHFIGLTHTTEIDGALVDPLEDTPDCKGIIDIRQPSTLDLCPDKDNLMFPTLWSETLRVSGSQRLVLQGSPTYKAFVGAPLDAGAPDADRPPGLLPVDPSIFGPMGKALQLTRSGRPLTAAERTIFGGLCGESPRSLRLRPRHKLTVPRAELARMATDLDLPGVIRLRAQKLLARQAR